jgi:uncharacterized protein (DUF305 family)
LPTPAPEPTDPNEPTDEPTDGPADAPAPHQRDEPPARRLAQAFGPLTGLRVLVLVVAMAFLGGAVGWTVAENRSDPLSSTDVGFLQDMGYHHEQAVEMAVVLLGKDDVRDGLKSFAYEIVLSQRFEQGIFNATLARFDRPTEVGDRVMGWMGPAVPRDSMEGLATEAQMADLREATGPEAESLWIALMSEHHLGGLHMADHEARHGHDRTVRNVALAIVKGQRSEIFDLARYRERAGLPVPDGFSDPRKDQRIDPLSTTGD